MLTSPLPLDAPSTSHWACPKLGLVGPPNLLPETVPSWQGHSGAAGPSCALTVYHSSFPQPLSFPLPPFLHFGATPTPSP